MAVYFTADTHFGHQAIINYENRPFANTDEMDDALIKNWNETVTPEDKVFILGDFSFHNEEKTKDIISKLNGYKHLIMGNHDVHFTVQKWLELGFDEVSSYPILFDEWYILSHYPLYINKNMPYANVFGHVHDRPGYIDEKQSICVCVEKCDYRPVLLKK